MTRAQGDVIRERQNLLRRLKELRKNVREKMFGAWGFNKEDRRKKQTLISRIWSPGCSPGKSAAVVLLLNEGCMDSKSSLVHFRSFYHMNPGLYPLELLLLRALIEDGTVKLVEKIMSSKDSESKVVNSVEKIISQGATEDELVKMVVRVLQSDSDFEPVKLVVKVEQEEVHKEVPPQNKPVQFVQKRLAPVGKVGNMVLHPAKRLVSVVRLVGGQLRNRD